MPSSQPRKRAKPVRKHIVIEVLAICFLAWLVFTLVWPDLTRSWVRQIVDPYIIEFCLVILVICGFLIRRLRSK